MGMDRNIHGKNRMEENRDKICDFSEKIENIQYFADFSASAVERAWERVRRGKCRRFIGDKLKKSAINWRFIGDFSR